MLKRVAKYTWWAINTKVYVWETLNIQYVIGYRGRCFTLELVETKTELRKSQYWTDIKVDEKYL